MLYTSDGETRQEYEIIPLGRPLSGEPAANDEASAAGWFTVAELDGLDIHPTQWRQLRDLSLVISLVPEICHVPVCRLCSGPRR